MASTPPERYPGKRAGEVSAGDSPQSSSGKVSARLPSGLALPSVPDHELLRCIGRGAYGAVWLARNVMGTYRAVKLVQGADFARERPFLREYEGLLNYEPVSRSHPNLMQILHVGRRDNYFYYVTELADDAGPLAEDGRSKGDDGSPAALVTIGQSAIRDVQAYVPRTLQEDLGRRGRLPIRECLRVAVPLASALKHLHDHKLVHRDVKPSNVIFVHGVPKLADIGLVATAGDSRSIVGTEGYLPPEGPGSAQADLFSLGKMLYEISTGMDRGEYPRLPPNLRELPDAKELLEFNEVLLKACARETDRRYQDADGFLADLALLERGDSVRRLHRLERHHALLKRLGVAALVVGLLVWAAWWESWRARRVAHRHLAQLHVHEGTQHMVEGDYAAALPWLVGALELQAGDGRLETVHRTRIASVLDRSPVPVAHFAEPGTDLVTADLSPDGAVVATLHNDGWVRLWDTLSGKQIQQLPHDFPVAVCQFLPSGNRLLTVTFRQEAHIWDLTKPGRAPLTFVQSLSASGAGYSVGLNERLYRVYLSKGRYIFPRYQSFTGPFSNLTLGLRLTGKGDDVLVKAEVRRTGMAGEALYAGEFLDTPEAEVFVAGSDNPAKPLWGRLLLMLENPSWAESRGTFGETIWDNLRMRSYRTGEPPAAWRVLDDFSSGRFSNWVHMGSADEGRSCRIIDGQLVLSCTNLPAAHTVSGVVLFRQPLEMSRNHTLEVEVDLVSVRAPYRIANLGLLHLVFDPLSAPERSFVAHGRWLATTFWDAPIRIYDLENPRLGAVGDRGEGACRELAAVGEVLDMDFSRDSNFVAVVWTPDLRTSEPILLRVWDFQTGLEVALDRATREGVSSARFSPDNRYLAVCRGNGLELLRTTDWQSAAELGTRATFRCPRFSPRGSRLAAVRDELEIVVWDLGDLEAPPVTFPHQARIQRIAFSPDGRFLAASAGDTTVRILDVVERQPLGPPLPGVLGRFSPDGTQVLVCGPQTGVWLWDLSRIEQDPLLVPPLRGKQRFASSTNRKLRAEITGKGITLQTQTGQGSLILPLQVPVNRVAFAPDSRCLIAESADGRAWICDAQTRTLLEPPKSLRYEVSLTNHSLPHLRAETRDRRTLSDMAALLGGQRPDGSGGMNPVEVAERARLLVELKRAHPTDFKGDDAVRLRWHRALAKAAELAMDWDAAVFHWERALEGKSEIRNPKSEVPVASRLAYARQAAEVVRRAMAEEGSRWSVILPRQPWATSDRLDLDRHYLRPLGQPLLPGRPGTAFRALAAGMQELGGTGFDVRGIIDLRLTNEVEIKIGRACQQLHFLWAANPASWSREKAGSCEVTFASGRKAAKELENPDDVAPFSSERFHEIAALSRTNASGLRVSLVWSGCAPGLNRRQDTLYLTRATWDLTGGQPGEVVQSLALRAGPSQSAPLIFAITVE